MSQEDISKTFESQILARRRHVQQENGVWTFSMSLDEFRRAHDAGTKLGCIDEGVVCGPDVAGSYILVGHDIAVDMLRDRVLAGEITGITSHSGCGAAKIYCDREGIETESPDDEGFAFSKELARRLSKETERTVTHTHIAEGDMSRPREYHDATMVYLSAETFDPHLIDAAEGFVINPHYHHDREYTKAEMSVAADIAFGDYGFGPERLTDQNPFIIAPIGSPKSPVEELQTLAGEVFVDDTRPIVVAQGITIDT